LRRSNVSNLRTEAPEVEGPRHTSIGRGAPPEPAACGFVDDLKLFRINPDSSQTIINFNYSDLLWNNSGLSIPLKIPGLHAGDILLVPGSPKWFLKDYLGLILSIVSTIASIATLLVYINK